MKNAAASSAGTIRMYWRAGLSVTLTKPCSTPPGNAHDIADLGVEALAVHLVEVAPLEDAEDFRFGVGGAAVAPFPER